MKPDLSLIAVVIEDLRPPFDEGAKKACHSLLTAFIHKGARVTVFTRHKDSDLKEMFLLPGNRFLLGFSFYRALKSCHPDIILYIPTSSGTLGAFLRAALIKLQHPDAILALLSLQYRKLPAITQYLNPCRYVDIVFTQSQASAAEFRQFCGTTLLVPGGVDRAVFHPVSPQDKQRLRATYGIHEEDRVILHVGHCNEERNITALLPLIRSGCKVMVIASTSTVIDQKLLAALREAGAHVVSEYLNAIQHFYQIADCYVFPVLNSASAIDVPLSVLEAMSCNLPIVTTPFGGLPGLFTSGKGFYYWNPNEDIAAAVDQAIHDSDCDTSAMISPYTWDHASSIFIHAFKEAQRI